MTGPDPSHHRPNFTAPNYAAPNYAAPGYGPPHHGAPGGQRPGQATAAGVIGVVIGGLNSFVGLFVLAGLGVVFDVSAFLGLLALLAIATAVALLVGGIQALTDRSPRLLLLGSFGSIAVQLLYMIVALVHGEAWMSGLLGFVLPGLIVFFLQQPRTRQYYAARGHLY